MDGGRKTTKADSSTWAMEIMAERNVAKFVRESFSCKECSMFVPKVNGMEKSGQKSSTNSAAITCHCGATSEEHCNIEKLPISSSQWDESKCIQKFPTNAYGRIRFTSFDFASSQSTKYLRLTDDTDPQITLEFMTRCWRLIEDYNTAERPQLIISVVGGGRMFNLAENVQKKIFNRELMRAVATTNGWLLTSGLDVGVAHAVGDSMREAQGFVLRDDYGKFKNRICCIGIAPWGGVYGGNRLGNADPERTNDVTYPVFATGMQWRYKKRLPLNPYHTHFLLVDDGYRNRERGVAEFRAKLERQIALPFENGGLGIPVVQILIDGAANALEIVAKSVAEGVPVLVCEGTGRAADLLSQVCRIYGRICQTTDETEKTSKLAAFQHSLRERVITYLYADHTPTDPEERFDRCVRDILQICENRQLVTIFNAKRGSALDTAILASLMDRTQHTERSSQLSLALKWNRIDVAKAKIFGNEAPIDSSLDLWPFFFEALSTNKPEFVRLFIEYGLDVKSSMTVRDLTKLYYETVEPQTLLWRLLRLDLTKLKQNPLSLFDMYKVIKQAARGFDHPLYSRIPIFSTDQDEVDFMGKTFDEPFDELFIWAVLTNNEILAIKFWEQCEQPLATGLVGTLICYFLATEARGLTGALRDQQIALKSKLEALAINLAVKAFEANREQTMLLLHRRWKKWGNNTCMELAAMAKDQVFLSSEPCQYAIWKTWTRGFEASGFAIALCALTGFPILFLIRFDEENKGNPSDLRGSAVSIAKNAIPTTMKSTRISLVPEIIDGPLRKESSRRPTTDETSNNKNGGDGGLRRFLFNGSDESLNFLAPFDAGLKASKKYVTFYTSPSGKFATYTLSYLIYLLLYAYVILFSFRIEPSASEMLLHLWTLTLLCEQIRTVIIHSGETFKDKTAEWWIHSSMAAWNRLDFLMLFMYSLAILFRFTQTTFKYARLIFALNYITCLFRLFKIYFVNSYLGPKVVMLKRMAFDLAMFLLVLIIILLSYTVVSHALLFPFRDFYTGVFWNLLYHGVWVLFGEVQNELDRAMSPICPVSSNETVSDLSQCDTHNLTPPILLAAYCFFGNILLVNMLIATFTNVFEEVQKNSEHLWKYLMYFVVKEFNEKPSLPPPFIVVEHLVLLLNHCRKCKIFGGKAKADLVWGKSLTMRHYRFLSVFEKTIRSDLVEQKQSDDLKQMEKLLPEMHERMHRIYALLKSLKSDLAGGIGGRKRKGMRGAFVPSMSHLASKVRRRKAAPPPPKPPPDDGGPPPIPESFATFSSGRFGQNMENDVDGDDLPMIDEDTLETSAAYTEDFFEDEDAAAASDEEDDYGREKHTDILEHLS